jgi:hypothetical protein
VSLAKEALGGDGSAPPADEGGDATARLYRHLGYTGPLPPSSTLEAPAPLPRGLVPRGGAVLPSEASAALTAETIAEAEAPPLDLTAVEVLKERLRAEPDAVLSRARALWDAEMSPEELEVAIEQASQLLSEPELGLRRIHTQEEFARATVKKLPPEFFQDWPYDPKIPIDPSSTKFETKADAVNWVLFSGPALIGSQFAKKAPFEWHHLYPSKFVYERSAPSPNAPISIGLAADFGTGLYHSRYIAKHLRERGYPYVIHGGDVYYAGRDSEFQTNFKPQVEPLLAKAQVFTMNANHEMYSLGKPYFGYIKDRKKRNPSQLQEGSYFCLRFGKVLQVVGIDTAYFRDGRFDESSLLRWLREVLQRGRELGMVNVLFSPNEPYSYGSKDLTDLLTKDLDEVVLDQKLVDLWFWGNTHYCALFDRTAGLPFVGSCIGHGGYPYGRMKAGSSSAAPVRFLETGARFPAWTEVRQDRGNNGFCELVVHHDKTVQLNYFDWMMRSRCSARLGFTNGVYGLTSVSA